MVHLCQVVEEDGGPDFLGTQLGCQNHDEIQLSSEDATRTIGNPQIRDNGLGPAVIASYI